ncbi:2og-fe oxygenase [Diaporthe eres]|uniref:Fe2OG dioxygenase domain-containing protein n=1 Tax=Diaporthe vaccinii TaxID=105482 RepID=A0ABR4EYZ0_9PEZI|nr:2og-fe oxygenase [Diaporthe eres]
MGSLSSDSPLNAFDGVDGTPPAFPADVPVAHISNISHQKILDGDVDEIARVIKSARDNGFFRVDLRESEIGNKFLAAARNMFVLAKETFDLPTETKLDDSILKHGEDLFGYKGLGASVVDKDGTPDNNEQYWISCGDIEGTGRHSRAIYNDVINRKNAQLKEFIDLGKAVTDRFLEVFSAVLAIPPESEDYLTKLYSHTNDCGSHVRLLKCPPKPKDAKVSLQPHTDWGMMTVLFNMLGGLQIYVPEDRVAPGEQAGWKYVKPEPGMAIFNLGDAFVKWSDGELKSSIHRVTNPPGEQANYTRYSLAYFTRPNNEALLKPLGRKAGITDEAKEYETFIKWAMRRAMAGKTDGFKKGDWEKGQGTETALSAQARVAA